MHHRSILRASAVAACALLSLGLGARPAAATPQEPAPVPAEAVREPRPRSVLFYLMDTCRDDRMGYQGYGRETTPFLAWLAERAVTFEACTSQAAWTKPSMAALLSSRYPSATGVARMTDRLPDEVLTWPEVLRENGFYTAGFSANIVMGNTLSNLAQGFDHFVESTAINRGDPIRFASGSAKLLNEHVFRWLGANERWPLLLYVHSVDPHEEYEPEPAYLERFADPARHERFREEWRKLLASRPPIPGLYVTQENFDETGVDSASFVQHASNLYDADIRANDDQMQRLWDELQARGWGEDVIFVFTSDHGEEFFDHGGTSHGYSLYEEMVNVPLMIYAPGLLPAGKRVTTPVRSIDVFPTLCELLGLDVPAGLEGRSLVALARGEEEASAPAVFSEHSEDPLLRRMGQASGVMVSVRKGRFKLIVNQTSSQLIEKPRLELFDLEKDPRERNNVAAEHPDVVRELEREVATFVARHHQGESVQEWVPDDPEVLAQLRALGYVGGEPRAPDLWRAMASGRLDEVRAALRAGADVERRDETFGVTPLGQAALAGNLELARLLLKAGAAVDAQNRDQSTPLIGAAFLGRAEIVALLLDRGANSAARNATGDTALGATQVPWEITAYLAELLGLEAERAKVQAGRLECAALLRAAEED